MLICKPYRHTQPDRYVLQEVHHRHHKASSAGQVRRALHAELCAEIYGCQSLDIEALGEDEVVVMRKATA